LRFFFAFAAGAAAERLRVFFGAAAGAGAARRAFERVFFFVPLFFCFFGFAMV
jgi:hypothetical protein